MFNRLSLAATLKAISIAALVIGLVGCGGGADKSAQALHDDSRQRALSYAAPETPQALSIVGLTKVSDVRIGRTTFDYTFRVSIRNDGQARADIVAQLISAGAGTSVIAGVVRSAVLDAGATVLTEDTITIRHDRAFPFAQSALVWNIQSTRAVVISGIVTDDPVWGAAVVVTSLLNGSSLATVTTDNTGAYSTPPIAPSVLAKGYSVTASGGTSAGAPFVGTMMAVFSLPADYASSHVTVLSTIVVRTAQSTASGAGGLAQTVEDVAARAIARGQLSAAWRTLDTATAYATSVAAAIRRAGLDAYTAAQAWDFFYEPVIAGNETVCVPGRSERYRVCSARVGSAGGHVFDQPGTWNGNLLVTTGPTRAGCLVDVSAEISDGGHTVRTTLALARGFANSLACAADQAIHGQLFDGDVVVSLPPLAALALANVPGDCTVNSHIAMPTCLTRRALIQPGVFVLDRDEPGLLYYEHRVPSSPTLAPTHRSRSRSATISRSFGANLMASPSHDIANLDTVAVLFVHGYTVGEDFGGDTGTWGGLPDLVARLALPGSPTTRPRLEPYNFQWRTNASFYTAAQDLAAAVEHIRGATGRKVHIVAHSFGGILVRTMLQRTAGGNADRDWSDAVASVTTLGTPHSGISSDGAFRGGFSLPIGWAPDSILPADHVLFQCGQISCYEAGLNTAWVAEWGKRALIRNSGNDIPVAGYVINELTPGRTSLPAGIRFQSLIGLAVHTPTAQPGPGAGGPVLVPDPTFKNGDHLISFYGQRFTPRAFALGAEPSDPMLAEHAVGTNAYLTERVLGLGFGVSAFPGNATTHFSLSAFARWGYVHTRLLRASSLNGLEAEVSMDCGGGGECLHDSWQNIRGLLLAMHGGEPSPNFPYTTGRAPSNSGGRLNDTGVTASQCYAAGSDALVSCVSAAALALNAQQDGMIGRDVTHNDNGDGNAGFSYSLVPKAGGGSYDKTECVKDNVSGLMWEGKTADGGPRDGGRTYTNRGDGSAGDAGGYVASVNSAGLCGFNDWRLPTARELQDLVDYGVAFPGPTIERSWFPNTRSDAYWSSSPVAGYPGDAWNVNFFNSSVVDHSRGNAGRVRLVR
ncbi:MAG: DUF1566 domain-containing protein [Rubrivivax sp.]|nr:DUF1566 domain-containing protein [Rubrivivax sp.]